MDPPTQLLELLPLLGTQRGIRGQRWITPLAFLHHPAAQQPRTHADLLRHVRARTIRIQHQRRRLSTVLGVYLFHFPIATTLPQVSTTRYSGANIKGGDCRTDR